MYKFRYRNRQRSRHPGNSQRKGGRQHYPRQRRPLPLARAESRSRLRPYAPIVTMDASTFKSRREFPSSQARGYLRMKRLPLLGLRSQQVASEAIGFDSMMKNIALDLREIKDPLLRKIPAKHSVCAERSKRRSVLFARRVAGKGFRRSPGHGGTYRRTIESDTSCERSRK